MCGVGNAQPQVHGEVRLHLHQIVAADEKDTTCVVANSPLNFLDLPYICENGFENMRHLPRLNPSMTTLLTNRPML